MRPCVFVSKDMVNRDPNVMHFEFQEFDSELKVEYDVPREKVIRLVDQLLEVLSNPQAVRVSAPLFDKPYATP